MILTGQKFAAIGEALAGPRWKSVVAIWLGKGERTIHGYANGTCNVPRSVRKKFAVLCYTRGSALVRLAIELDRDIEKIATNPAIDNT